MYELFGLFFGSGMTTPARQKIRHTVTAEGGLTPCRSSFAITLNGPSSHPWLSREARVANNKFVIDSLVFVGEFNGFVDFNSIAASGLWVMAISRTL